MIYKFLYDFGRVKAKFEFDVKEVYGISPRSLLLAKHLKVKKNASVLDLGCGCGFLGILTAKMGAKEVICTDIIKTCKKL